MRTVTRYVTRDGKEHTTEKHARAHCTSGAYKLRLVIIGKAAKPGFANWLVSCEGVQTMREMLAWVDDEEMQQAGE